MTISGHKADMWINNVIFYPLYILEFLMVVDSVSSGLARIALTYGTESQYSGKIDSAIHSP